MLTLVLATLLADPKLVVGVVSNAADTAKFAASTDLTKLTHVVVAYENPVDADGTLSFNPADEALVARAKAADVRVLVALGGPAAKDPALAARYADLMSEPKRRGFMRKVNGYLKAHGFQGVDLELDGSVIGKDFGAFVDALGNGLFNQGWLYGVTLSKATMPEDVPATAFANCDFVAAMPDGDASAEAAKASVAYWVGRGIPKTKLLLGIPFRALGSGTPYAEIVAKYPGAETKDSAGGTLSYNGQPTARAKAKLVQDQGLAGVMLWTLDADAPGDKSLLSALATVLRP